jgi:hypothetical protein
MDERDLAQERSQCWSARDRRPAKLAKCPSHVWCPHLQFAVVYFDAGDAFGGPPVKRRFTTLLTESSQLLADFSCGCSAAPDD